MEEDKMKKQRALVNKKNKRLQKIISRVEDSEDDYDVKYNKYNLQQKSMNKDEEEYNKLKGKMKKGRLNKPYVHETE